MAGCCEGRRCGAANLTETGRGGANNFQCVKGSEATACGSGRRQLGETESDVIAARSRVRTVATASAHLELVAAAAAWNWGGCVYPSAVRRETEGRGNEGHPTLELGGGLRALPRTPPASGPGAFPALFWGPHTSPLVSPKRDVQVGPALLSSVSRPGLSAQRPLFLHLPHRKSLVTLLKCQEMRQWGVRDWLLAPHLFQFPALFPSPGLSLCI